MSPSRILAVAAWAAAIVLGSSLRLAQAATSLFVSVDAGASGLAPGGIRDAIARELGVALTADRADGVGELRVVVGGARRAVITYRGPERGAPLLERSLDLPSEPDRATEMLALMAGNLARNEAADLLQSLRPPPPPSPPVVTPAAAPEAPPAPSSEDAPLRDAPLNLTLVHPIELVPNAEQHRFALELGFAYSRVGAIGGAALNPFAIRVDHDLDGAAATFVWSSIGGDTRGAVLSGIASWGGGSLSGAEMALAFLWRGGNAEGLSASGVFLGSNGDLSGLGFALAATYRGGNVNGVQLSGVTNVNAGDVSGMEGAIAFNLARDVDGLQLGLVNVGRTVRGVQLGLVNVADEVHGVPIGLVNVIKKGRTQAVTWASGGPTVNAGVKYLNGPVYTMVTFGWRPENLDDSRYETGFGLGFRIPISPAFLEADTLYAADRPFKQSVDRTDILRYRVMGGLEITSYLSAFGGLSLRHEIPRAGPAKASLEADYVAGIQLF